MNLCGVQIFASRYPIAKNAEIGALQKFPTIRYITVVSSKIHWQLGGGEWPENDTRFINQVDFLSIVVVFLVFLPFISCSISTACSSS